jgi:AcrR family transcriptional regulator
MVVKSQARRYDASGRRAQARVNRDRILARARELFIRDGFAGTSVAAIARAAGVSAPTVFAAFGSKVNLLKEAAETTIVGDTQPIPMAERPEMRYVHAGATAEEALDRLADLIAERASAVYPIFSVMYAAQDAYTEIAELVDLTERQRLMGAAALARTIATRLDIQAPDEVAELRDAIWAAMSVVHYEMLVVKRSWPVERYREWIRAALQIPVDWMRGS